MKNFFFTISFFILHLNVSAQSTQAKLEEFLDAYANQNKLNGTALVAQKGKILIEKGYGFRDANLAARNDINTIYQVGSVTKQFTSAIILRLQEQNKLSVKDRLNKYFPDFPNGDKITIEHLLTHTSGIYNYTNDDKFMMNETSRYHGRDNMMALFKAKPLEFEPGSKWSYSNSGYLMLGYIIELVTKKPYERLMREYILQPLHMDNSGFDFANLKSPDKAVGYFLLDSTNRAVAPIVDSSVSFAAGSLYSTVRDMYKWERSMYGNSLLKQETWKLAFTPFRNKYGYGWSIDTMFNRQVTSHGGGIFGFNANIFRVPQEEIVIILLNNKGNSYLDEITRGLAAIMLGQKYELPKVRVSILVSDSLLQQYVGEYELSPAFKITIKLENGGLKGQATGQPQFDMYAEKQHSFFLKIVDARIEFVKGVDGNIEKMILYQNGAEIPGKKIK